MKQMSIDELKEMRTWMLWKKRERNGKVAKVPFSAKGGTTGTNQIFSHTWVTYLEAEQAALKTQGAGIGFKIPDGVFFLDIDHKDFKDPVVQDMISQFNSYTEYSVSGDGIHVYGLCDFSKLPTYSDLKSGRIKLSEDFYTHHPSNGLEIYIGELTNRYAAFTGNVIIDQPLQDCTNALIDFLDKYMRKPQTKTATAKDTKPKETTSKEEKKSLDKKCKTNTGITDNLVDKTIANLRIRSNGDKFSRLFDNGEMDGCTDHSKMDIALCFQIAFCTSDKALIDAVFRRSALYREDKWEREDYTIVTYDANGGSSAPEPQSYLDAWRDNILTTAIVGSRLRITDELPINPGYHFVGWGETPNATTAAYKPGEKLSKDAPSMALYAIWEICNSHTYEINMDESTIICTNCAAPIPMDEFRFSDFWKLRYPKKSKLEQLSEKQLESALNDYIKIKTLMTAKELKDTQRLVDWSNVGGSNSFQLIGSLVDQFSYDLKHVTLQNTEAFYLLFNSLVVATGEQGYDNLATKIINGVNNTITVTSFGEFVTAAVNANLKAEKLELTKNQGKQYTYFAHEDLINLAVANTRTIAALATFLGNFCNISINAPSVDVNQLTTAFADIAKTNKLAEIYRILSLPISTNPSQLNVNEMLPTGVSGSFAEINIYSQENIYNAMKGGPTAAEFVNHIPSILENISNVHGDKAKVEFALWYYYGWRMQYDYARFIEGILNNWI